MCKRRTDVPGIKERKDGAYGKDVIILMKHHVRGGPKTRISLSILEESAIELMSDKSVGNRARGLTPYITVPWCVERVRLGEQA